MLKEINASNIRLSIVFLNYNRLKDTVRTLSVLNSLCGTREDIEIIAVDNGSSDGTAVFLNRHRDLIKIMLLPDNLGIGALNKAFEKASGDYIFVLDDDSHPLDGKTLDLLIEGFNKDKNTGVIACHIESENGVNDQKTWHLHPTGQEGESVAFVGCGFAVRRELFQKIGWFPGNFFLYQNEIDVAIKIARLGYHIKYEPRCRVVHRNSPTGRAHWRQVFYPTRNTIWLLRKYAPFPEVLYYIFSRVCFGFMRAVQSGEFRWYLSALFQGFREKIDKETLSPDLCRRFLVLWQQNSIFHHVKWGMKSLRDSNTLNHL
ncbi:Glycosyltransferase [Desulfamplus magnetovallimortis]|uniref:Glycosyltransferase n=1 Tax=Desulfamplus magnetovallimortis TaxID=1246637 RepID=A0A1W1HBX9_9BACT|nr:glycosyltransferase family 2 protein [Desulfamplus magnetovallimortis]SLM29997.1 Glycosyltransferase [Desulfamplus magnetovallimortis]